MSETSVEKVCCVYWAHLPEHTDMFTQGYIGFTHHPMEYRWRGHQRASGYKHLQHYPFYKAMRKHGDRIVVEKILVGDSAYCLDAEYRLRPRPAIGWNTLTGGDAPTLGSKRSAATCAKISKASKSRPPPSEATREKLRIASTGRRLSQDTRKRMSVMKKNRVDTPETRAKQAAAKRGKKQTPESIAKRVASLVGIKHLTVVCPHCGKRGGLSGMKRWHFDHCMKNKTSTSVAARKQEIITCPHCNKSGGRSGMRHYHFDKCEQRTVAV